MKNILNWIFRKRSNFAAVSWALKKIKGLERNNWFKFQEQIDLLSSLQNDLQRLPANCPVRNSVRS